MQIALTFKNYAVTPYDHGDGSLWFTARQASKMLGYANVKSVTNLYNANRDEFSASMTEVIDTVTSGNSKGCGNLKTKVRIFSLRGLHLLGMLAETTIAKDLRRWALDLIEKELSQGDIQHSIQQMQNIVASARKASDEDSSDAGRRLRKRQDDLPMLAQAERLVTEIGQISFELIGGGKE